MQALPLPPLLFLRALFLPALAFGAVLTAQAGVQDADAPPKAKLQVRVLYAGDADHARTAQWRTFLGRYFEKVGTVAMSSLSRENAKDFDVVIIDSPSPYQPNRGFEMPKPARLPEDWARPTILMGAAGGSVIRSFRIKIGWL